MTSRNESIYWLHMLQASEVTPAEMAHPEPFGRRCPAAHPPIGITIGQRPPWFAESWTSARAPDVQPVNSGTTGPSLVVAVGSARTEHRRTPLLWRPPRSARGADLLRGIPEGHPRLRRDGSAAAGEGGLVLGVREDSCLHPVRPSGSSRPIEIGRSRSRGHRRCIERRKIWSLRRT